MEKQRTREEIESEVSRFTFPITNAVPLGIERTDRRLQLIMEILLDIRDLLSAPIE